jgi:uncharacterized LabA/DUF88 family protein
MLKPGNAPTLPGSALFIDLPNLLRGQKSYRDINWPQLVGKLTDELLDTRLTRACAYAKSHSEAQTAQGWLERMLMVLHVNGIDIAMCGDKDIDPILMSDIWESVTLYVEHQRSYEVAEFPLQMRHVLVSGDGDYLRAYRGMYKAYDPDDLELELVVYAWRDHVHSDLLKVARRVYYLDDIPNLLTGPRLRAAS